MNAALEERGHKSTEKEIGKAVRRLGHKDVEDAMSAIGRGDLLATDMLRALGLDVDDKQVRAERRKASLKKSSGHEKDSIPVRGVKANSVLKFHTSTGAVPGERIVGIVTPGEGVTIYPIFARALEQFDSQPERWVDLAWGPPEDGQRFPARLKVTLINEVGALAQVTQVIGDFGGNIDALEMHARHGVRDFFELSILVEVFDVRHLTDIMNGLRAKPLVSEVTRDAG